MLKILAALVALVLPTAAMAQTPPPQPVEVMILGTYHFGNPGRDIHNARIDSVLTPEKQAQLEAVAEGLAHFRPTAVAVERVAADQATMLDQRYPAFTPADLLTNPDERVQIGYRLAANSASRASMRSTSRRARANRPISRSATSATGRRRTATARSWRRCTP